MKKCFTIIELLIVFVIIGILAAALIPRLHSINKGTEEYRVWNNAICYWFYGKIVKKSEKKLVIETKVWEEKVFSSYECEKTD